MFSVSIMGMFVYQEVTSSDTIISSLQWFSFRSHHNKIVPKDLQPKNKIKTELSEIILQHASKLLLQERIHINHVIRDRLKN